MPLEEVGSLLGHEDRVRCLLVLPAGAADEPVVISGGDDGLVVWQGTHSETGAYRLLCRLQPEDRGLPTALAWMPGRRTVAVGFDSGLIDFYELQRDLQLQRTLLLLDAHNEEEVTQLVYDPERDLLLSCGLDKAFTVFSPASRTLVATSSANHGALNALCFSSSKMQVFAAAYSGKILIYQLNETTLRGLLVETLPGSGSMRCLVVDTAGPVDLVMAGGFARVLFVWTGDNMGADHFRRHAGIEVQKQRGLIRCLAHIKARSMALTGSDDGRIRAWNLDSGAMLPDFPFDAHQGSVLDLVWDPDQELLFSCGTDEQIKVWKIVD